MVSPDDAPPLALPPGHRLGGFELLGPVHADAGDDALLYRARDTLLSRTVAIAEYLPRTGATRRDGGVLAPATPAHARGYADGLARFVEHARWLAEADHPNLLRVLQLVQTQGTAYRVMPWTRGQTLQALRRRMPAPPDEAALRALLADLLGALQALHRAGHAHGAVHPDRILMRDDDRALLLAPAGGAHRPEDDLRDLARVARFCISGVWPDAADASPPEPLAATLARLQPAHPRLQYAPALLQALDRAASADAAARPRSAAEFRAWLGDAPPVFDAATATADDGTDDATKALIRRVIDAVPDGTAPRRTAAPLGPSTAPAPPLPSARPAAAAAVAAGPPRRRRARTLAAVLGGLALAGVAAAVLFDPSGRLPAGQRAEPVAALPVQPALPDAGTAARANEALAALDAGALPAPAAGPAAPPAPDLDAKPGAGGVGTKAPALVTPAKTAPRDPVPTPRKNAARPSTPRQACGERTQFSLYRCMQKQCAQSAWRKHAQCERLRRTGEVD